jgi:amino-acid N-acetyltransferase
MTIERAQPADAPAILALLEQNQLPPAGLTDHMATAMVARDEGRIVGSAVLETYRDGVLLRSVALAPALQHQGLGRALTAAALALAADLHAPAVFLLTTTAERYFLKFGFAPIDRDVVPDSVRSSVEFRSAYPTSAIVMRKW